MKFFQHARGVHDGPVRVQLAESYDGSDIAVIVEVTQGAITRHVEMSRYNAARLTRLLIEALGITSFDEVASIRDTGPDGTTGT